MDLIYKPQFKLIANGKDITRAIAKSFIDLSLTDVAGDKADTLVFKLDGSKIKTLPAKSAELHLSLGFEKLYKQGVFFVSSIGESGPPDIITIKATSIPLVATNRIQTQKNQSWDNITILELLKTVAKRNNLIPVINKNLGEITIEHLDQTSESDMALMTRIARQYGAISKVTHARWLFLKDSDGKNASGTKDLKLYTIDKSTCSSYQYNSSGKADTAAVIAKWNNEKTGESGVERVGVGEPAFQIIYPFLNKDEAQKAAAAKAKTLKNSSDTFNFTTQVTNQLITATAESQIKAVGWRKEISNQTWCIKQISKNLSVSGGLQISFDCSVSGL